MKKRKLSHRLGQHFLHNTQILEKIVKASGIDKTDIVVEIGAGKGKLTKLLADVSAEVIAIEIDKNLCEELKNNIYLKNVKIICSDILKFDFKNFPPFKVVSNIPYYITTPIIFHILDEKVPLLSATLTVQKEVAERIVATAGSKKYGVLSIMVQLYTEPKILFFIPKSAFIPPPKVDSAVIFFKKLPEPIVSKPQINLFKNIVKAAFRQRRKTLSNSLKIINKNIKEILILIGIDPKARAETLTIEEFKKITQEIYNRNYILLNQKF